jgi:hypothetical protein
MSIMYLSFCHYGPYYHIHGNTSSLPPDLLLGFSLAHTLTSVIAVTTPPSFKLNHCHSQRNSGCSGCYGIGFCPCDSLFLVFCLQSLIYTCVQFIMSILHATSISAESFLHTADSGSSYTDQVMYQLLSTCPSSTSKFFLIE